MAIKNPNVKMPGSLRMGQRALRTGLAVGVSALVLAPALTVAQEALPTVKVQGEPNPNAEAGAPYKAKTSGDERNLKPVAETPKTLSIITKDAIEESGYTDLKEILDAQPGITVGTGENGNAFGDRYIIRGQDARSDTFVDGLRDPGMTTRESFAVEQVEISKGPDSTFAGRGSAGGAINLITKEANPAFDFTTLQVGVGSDQYVRTTVDSNYVVSDKIAVRANALYAYREVPDRGPADRERRGGAVSTFFAPSDQLDITLDYYGLYAKDLPDLGSYLINDTVQGRIADPNAPVYAQEGDFLKSIVNNGTARIRYTFNDNIRFTNITRYAEADNSYGVTGSSSITAYTGGTGTAAVAYATGRLSDHQGWQEVRYVANQSNLFIDSTPFNLDNKTVLTAEYTDHKVLNGVFTNTKAGAFNCRTSATVAANNSYCTLTQAGTPVAGLNTLLGRTWTKSGWDSDWHVRDVALSFINTIDFTSELSLFAGGRADHYKYYLDTRNNTTGVVTDYGSDADTFFNGYAGLTYKIVPEGMVYATIGTAADINGGESDVGASSGYGGAVVYNGSVAGAKPERSVNIEVGTKWNILDEKLLLTGAVFQATKSDVMEGAVGADYDAAGVFNTGKNRVRGIELGLVGRILPQLEAQVGGAIMKARVRESYVAARVGQTLANFANRSLSAQLKYEVTPEFALGGAVKYESGRCGGQPDTGVDINATTGQCTQPVPAYTVGDLFATYRFNNNLNLRVNVNNVTNKDYYLAVYRGGSFMYKGDARSVTGTLSYEF
jgi:catecholate siderophore receptor